MIKAVFDTNALSYIFNDDTRGKFYRDLMQSVEDIFISHVTLVEQRYGYFKRGWGTKRIHSLESYLKDFCVIYPDNDMCLQVAYLQSTMEHSGRQIGHHDLWIATTAMMLECPVVTHNVRHFQMVPGLEVVTVAT